MIRTRSLSACFLVLFITALLAITACNHTDQQSLPATEASSPAATKAPGGNDNDSPLSEAQDDIEVDDVEDNSATTPTVTLASGEQEAQPTIEPDPQLITTREVPDDLNWKDIPIMPEITEYALAIYEQGIEMGRNPDHISVVGDCQAIPFVFLGRYGLGQFTLKGTDVTMSAMIRHYRDSFAREGAAVRGGFTAASVLSPVRADPDLCRPGENPLECEWRVHNPSIVFINLETWREEGTVDRYELYLQRIVEYALERGTLPIIIMKADQSEGETPIINPAMARVAYQYNLPIINFWRSAQLLDNRGIDPTREGFHLSQEGYERKEILALRTLYTFWQHTHQDIAEVEPTKAPTVTPLPTPTAQPLTGLPYPDFQCLDNCLYFDLFIQSGSGVQPMGIYEVDMNDPAPHLTAEGVSLVDVSDNFQQILVSRNNELHLIDRTAKSTSLIADNFFTLNQHTAYFADDANKIVALITVDNSQQIHIIDAISYTVEKTITPAASPISLLQQPSLETIYYETGSCQEIHFCQTTGLYSIETDSLTETSVENKEQLVFSPDGQSMAFKDPQYADALTYYKNNVLLYHQTDLGIQSQRMFTFSPPGGFRVFPDIRSYTFSPDGSQLIVMQDAYSVYFEKSVGIHLFLQDLDLRMVFDHSSLEGAYGSLNPLMVWSPDSKQVIFLLTNTANDRDYSVEFYLKDMQSTYSDFLSLMEPWELPGYGYPGHAFWIDTGNSSNETTP
jgi:uncharacterized protein YqiB (DUF1249 family)